MLEQEFKSICSLSGRKIAKRYKFLGEGIARKVYILDEEHVIKVAKGYDGIHQNNIENYVFTEADERLKSYLCPIDWFQPDKIIMKRALPIVDITKHRSKTIDFAEFYPDRDLERDLKRLSSEFYLYYKDLICPSSWGIYKDMKVLIDYGCTKTIGDFIYSVFFHW